MARTVEYHEVMDGGLERKDRFPSAVLLAKKGLRQLHKEGTIAGAFITGSATFEDAGPRSDLDVIVVGSIRNEATMKSLGLVAREIYDQTKVPLELSFFTEDELWEDRHPYRAPVLLWLREQTKLHPENIVGSNPTDLMSPRNVNLRTDLFGWLGTTAYQLEKFNLQGYIPRPDDLLTFVLNVPHIAGRKFMDVLQSDHLFPSDTMKSLKKSDIAEGVRKVLKKDDDRDLLVLYDDLTVDYLRYDRLVTEPGTRELDAEEYRLLIESTLKIDLPKAIKLLKKLQDVLVEEYSPSYDFPPPIPGEYVRSIRSGWKDFG